MAKVRRSAVRVFLSMLLLLPLIASGQSPEQLQKDIQNYNSQIKALDKEIAEYEKQLTQVGAKKQTLQNAIDQLNLQRKKLTTQIQSTQNTLKKTQAEIQTLSNDIRSKEGSIEVEEAGLAESLRRLNEAEEQSLVVAVLAAEDLTETWNDIDASYTLHEAIQENIDRLAEQKADLTVTKTASEKKKSELVKQQTKLTTEQGSLDATRKAQNELLTQTKSQESTYQALLAEKRAAKAAFESALSDLNARYQQAIDPSSIPPAGKGVLSWPLDNIRVTQYFGNTEFARSGAYNGNGHNGVDFAAPIGTPLKAALTGTVVGVGNTDAIRGCYSYGKWVMLKHGNGLSTMYAHMSQTAVSEGQTVATGQVIGYSGATGYATGPHLHFGVYLTEATNIVNLGQATNRVTPCANARMPVAPLTGYLNPMEYL